MFRRSWPMTKKQYRTPKVKVGTAKKSIAAIASRWFRRKDSQRRAGSGSSVARLTQRETVRSEMSKPSLRRSPRWVLRDHAKDQLAHFPADWFSSDRLSSSRDPTPVQPKAGPMPANHGLRSNEDQRPFPARPNSSQNDPEQPVDRTQSRARSLCVQSQQLLPKGEVLHEEFFSGAKDGDDPAEQISKTHKHQGIIAKSAPRRCACKSLILRTRRVLARDSHGLRGDEDQRSLPARPNLSQNDPEQLVDGT